MIAHMCRRCASSDLVKNGHTPTGRQKMRCKTCGFSSTLELGDLERRLKEEQVGKLSLERLSQRAISRTTGVSRMTIAKLQKNDPPYRRYHNAPSKSAHPKAR